MKRLTDPLLKASLRSPPSALKTLPDGAIPGLSVRLGTGGTANWSLLIRVAGEGGATSTGRLLLGPKHRINLGCYPQVSISSARAKAAQLLDQAKQGIHPRQTLRAARVAGPFTVEGLSQEFMEHHVHSRELDSAQKYELAFKAHINPRIGSQLAERLTREQVRQVMEAARIRRARPKGERGGPVGGVEAARTAMAVLRHMYTWAIDEGKIKREDNPVSKIDKNLPKAKQRDVVLSLNEARIVWQAAQSIGYPFGTHVQLMLLTGCRLDEWASARHRWIDLGEGLMVIPAGEYKSDHVHVVPLVTQALEIIRRIPEPGKGEYLLSSTEGRVPIQGVSKFYRTRLVDAILAITGEKFPKQFTSHDLRRTVATRMAESLGDEGDKLIKRVLGHSDGSVTAIYNRYGYVREMRRALEQWANDLTCMEPSRQSSPLANSREVGSVGARAALP
ncbi:MAG: tyrosine-type recombinase/integrase [Steroidobacteraceae bacterium]